MKGSIPLYNRSDMNKQHVNQKQILQSLFIHIRGNVILEIMQILKNTKTDSRSNDDELVPVLTEK